MLVSVQPGVFHLLVTPGPHHPDLALSPTTSACPFKTFKVITLGCCELRSLSLSDSVRLVNAMARWITFCIINVLAGKGKSREL